MDIAEKTWSTPFFGGYKTLQQIGGSIAAGAWDYSPSNTSVQQEAKDSPEAGMPSKHAIHWAFELWGLEEHCHCNVAQ